jgi:HD domain
MEQMPWRYKKMELPFTLETELEARICADAEWKKGAVWGKPRPGHSEGVVMYHIAEVLANVDRLATTPEERRVLRLIALIHDTFKYRVDPGQPKTGPNHHAAIARKFAERYLDNQALLEIIELHDEAFNSWRLGAVKGRWKEAEERASRLVARLGSSLPLYVCFYRADNATGSKENDSPIWFEQFLRRRGIDVPPEVK